MTLTELLNRPNDGKHFYFLGRKIPFWIYNAYCAIGMFAFGAVCSQLTTDVMKYTIGKQFGALKALRFFLETVFFSGRLRPHFYTVCLPDVNCSLAENQNVYHTDFSCTNPAFMYNKRIMKEMRLSFPSGHSSFSIYTMVYFGVSHSKILYFYCIPNFPRILVFFHLSVFCMLLFSSYLYKRKSVQVGCLGDFLIHFFVVFCPYFLMKA